MNVKRIAAALIGLCMTWGTAQAGPGDSLAQAAPPAAIAGDAPVGGTGGDVIILELGPMQGGHSAEDMAAMQLLLLQLLLMQSGAGGAPDMFMIEPMAPVGTGI